MHILRSFGRAFLLRCPNCGGRGVVRPWARMVEECGSCGHRFEREEGYWLGAVLLNTVVGVGLFAVIFVTVAVATWPDVPWTPLLIATIAINIAVPVIFYPWARTLWVALDLAVRPVEEPD